MDVLVNVRDEEKKRDDVKGLDVRKVYVRANTPVFENTVDGDFGLSDAVPIKGKRKRKKTKPRRDIASMSVVCLQKVKPLLN
jgi:hypothetical protein